MKRKSILDTNYPNLGLSEFNTDIGIKAPAIKAVANLSPEEQNNVELPTPASEPVQVQPNLQVQEIAPELDDAALEAAMNEQRGLQRNALLMRALGGIGEGGVIMAGGKPADSSSLYNAMDEYAKGASDKVNRMRKAKGEKVDLAKGNLSLKKDEVEVQNLLEDEVALRDANSQATAVLREAAVANGMPKEAASRATGKDILRVLPHLKKSISAQKNHVRNVQKEDGVHTVMFDSNGMEVADLGLAGYAAQFRNDAFGNIVGLQPGALNKGATNIVSSKREALPESSEERAAVVSSFRPDKEQTKAIENERKSFNSLNKNMRERIEAAKTLETLLEKPGKLAQGAASFQLPRLSGSNSQLSDTEREVFSNLPDLMSKVRVLINQKISGKIDPQLLKEYKYLVKAFEQGAKKATREYVEKSYNALEQNHAVPREFVQSQFESKSSLGSVSLQTPRDPGSLFKAKGILYKVNADGKSATKVE